MRGYQFSLWRGNGLPKPIPTPTGHPPCPALSRPPLNETSGEVLSLSVDNREDPDDADPLDLPESSAVRRPLSDLSGDARISASLVRLPAACVGPKMASWPKDACWYAPKEKLSYECRTGACTAAAAGAGTRVTSSVLCCMGGASTHTRTTCQDAWRGEMWKSTWYVSQEGSCLGINVVMYVCMCRDAYRNVCVGIHIAVDTSRKTHAVTSTREHRNARQVSAFSMLQLNPARRAAAQVQTKTLTPPHPPTHTHKPSSGVTGRSSCR